MAFDLPSNFSNGTDYISVDNLGAFMQYANYASGGYVGLAFLAVIFIVVASIGIMVDAAKSFLAASFITFIFSVYFWGINMCPIWVVMMLLVATIGAAIIVKSSKGNM